MRPRRPLNPNPKVKLGRLPFGPLYEELQARRLVTAADIAAFYGYRDRDVRRWAREGIGTYTADKLAVRLGLLPIVVWGDAFFDEELMAHEVSARGGKRRAFTDDDVRSIRARVAAGEQPRSIAREYGVAHTTVQDIAKGKNYAGVAA